MTAIVNFLIGEAQARAGGPTGHTPHLDNPVGFLIGMTLLFLVGVAGFLYCWWSTPPEDRWK